MAVYPLSTSIRSNVPADSLLYDLCVYRMDADRNKYYLIDVRQQKFKDNHQTQIHMSEDIIEPLSTIYIMEMTLYRKTMLHTHSVTPKPFTKMYTLAEFSTGKACSEAKRENLCYFESTGTPKPESQGAKRN